MADEIAVTGDRPIRKLLYLVFGFLDKGPAHGGYRFALSASMRFEVSALARSGANARGSSHSPERVLR